MGWLGKTLAFFLAIVLFGVGLWPVSLFIIFLLIVPPLLRLRGKKGARDGGQHRGRIPLRDIAGAVLLLLALVAYASHGTYSPVLFGSLGMLALLWGRVSISLFGSGLRPVGESILLRSWPIPFYWVAVAQVKPLTRDVGRAMACLDGTVVVSASTSSVYVVVERGALAERAGEAALMEALKEAADVLTPVGAYLLPLDSRDSAALLQPEFQAARLEESGWSNAVSSGPYDLVSIRQERGFAKGLGLSRRVGTRKDGRCSLPPYSLGFARQPLLLEVFKALGGRVAWPQPDQYAAFLGSLVATKEEPMGRRIVDHGEGSQSVVVVRSQGSPGVELSRAQLRAVARMYEVTG